MVLRAESVIVAGSDSRDSPKPELSVLSGTRNDGNADSSVLPTYLPVQVSLPRSIVKTIRNCVPSPRVAAWACRCRDQNLCRPPFSPVRRDLQAPVATHKRLVSGLADQVRHAESESESWHS